MKNALKRIGAVLAGIVVGAALSHGTDYALESVGVLPHGNLNAFRTLTIRHPLPLLSRNHHHENPSYVISAVV